MDTDEQAFLTAIAASPDDDTPRLVFADWLDERATGDDNARAALIRAQCRLEYPDLEPRERRDMETQVRKILRANKKQWLAPLQSNGFGSSWQFRRGFIDNGSLSATKFTSDGAKLFLLAPMLRAIKFPYARGEVTPLADCPFLARLASVDLTLMCTCGVCPIDVELRNLFQSKHAKNLTSLNVAQDRIDEVNVRALIQSQPLSQLTHLDLTSNPLGTSGITLLSRATNLQKLTSLNLSGTELNNAGIQTLATATAFPALRTLVLRENNIGASGIRAFSQSPLCAQLETLTLTGNRVGETGAAALAKLPATANVKWLDVRQNRLSAKAIQLLKARFGSGLTV
jgi:uncharacterized protein (TIGR02996 family)